jgi:S1-C subfamily serine protease
MFNLKRKGALALSGLFLVVFGFIVGTAVIPSLAYNHPAAAVYEAPAQQSIDLSTLNLTDQEELYATLYNQITPSVVSINVVSRGAGESSLQNDGGFAYGSGSGFVIDTEGHIVTNNHVVDGATSIEVNFYDGTIARGEIVGLDPDADLAVLKVNIDAASLHPVTFADSDQTVVGQSTIAIGSPFGEEWTMTTGIISALNRTIQGLTNFSIGSVIQTDAAINPGNSGGPLLNMNGQVIGVNSQIISRTQSNSGIGFAIPSNLVQRVVPDLLADGRVEYSYLGISGGRVDLALMETMGLPNNMSGIVVQEVVSGGPASQAGLQGPTNVRVVDGQQVPDSADIITAINGTSVSGMPALVSYLAANTKPGDSVNLTVWRGGQQINIPVTLSTRPG